MSVDSSEREKAAGSFIFFSFSRSDAKSVAPFVEKLKDAGYLFYYFTDEEAGNKNELSASVKDKIENCAIVIAFLSDDFLASPMLVNQIIFALKKGKTVISINSEYANLSDFIKDRFGAVQETARCSFSSQNDFMEKLDGFGYLDSCSKTSKEVKSTEVIMPVSMAEPSGDIVPDAFSKGDLSVNESDDGVITVFRAKKEKNAFLTNEIDNTRVQLTGAPLVIGKMLGAVDLRVDCNTVSRRHAEIIKEGRKFFITDLNSTNGTFINGKKIQGGVKQELSEGDRIILSEVPFRFTRE